MHPVELQEVGSYYIQPVVATVGIIFVEERLYISIPPYGRKPVPGRCSSLNKTIRYKLYYLYMLNMEGLIEGLYCLSIETEIGRSQNRNVRGEKRAWQTGAAVVLGVVHVCNPGTGVQGQPGLQQDHT